MDVIALCRIVNASLVVVPLPPPLFLASFLPLSLLYRLGIILSTVYCKLVCTAKLPTLFY